MPSTMRAVGIKGGTGPADALFIDQMPVPSLAPNQALVQIKAFGLNRMDLLQREGKYPLPPQAPETMGVEFSGTIVDLLAPTSPASAAAAEPQFKMGDEVFGLAYGGAYAEFIAVSMSMLIHKPAEMSWEEAAGIPETWITATQALFVVGGFKAGETVLFHAGASSVSLAGIQLAKAAGAAAVYVTAGSDDKIEFCKSTLGVTAGFNYHAFPADVNGATSWPAEILKATANRGVDLTIDFLGAKYFQGNLAAAARDGRIVLLALLGGKWLTPDLGVDGRGVDISPILLKRLRVEGSTLRSRDEPYQRRLRDMLVQHAMPRFRDGSFKVFVERVFAMDDIVEAHKLMESNQTKGKIICRI